MRFTRYASRTPISRCRLPGVCLTLAAGIWLLGGGIHPAQAASYRQQNQTFSLDVESRYVAVELDMATATPIDLRRNLAAEGFLEAKLIRHAVGRNRLIYQVTTNRADAETLKVLRTTPGVRAARRLYYLGNRTSALVPTDRIVLRPKGGVADTRIRELAALHKCEVVRTMGLGTTMYVLRLLDETDTDAVGVSARLMDSGIVEFAHADFLAEKKLHRVAIQDPLFHYQWHLENLGQTGGSPGADIKAVEAWDLTDGSGAIVAVLDDAIDWKHPDLVDNVVARYNFIWDDDDPTPTRPYPDVYCLANCDDPANWVLCYDDPCQYMSCWGMDAHGTCTAGLAVARANEVGVRGVAPMAGLVAEAMLNAGLVETAEAFYFAERNGAQVCSNSWGFVDPLFVPDVVVTAVNDIAVNGRGGKGVLVMFSSGNGSTRIDKDNYLAALPDVMAIGATLKDDVLTCYSSFGPQQSVVAPGGGSFFGYNLDPLAERCYEADMATTDVTAGRFPPDFEFPDVPQCLDRAQSGYLGLQGYNPPPPPGAGLMEYATNFADVYYSYRFNGTSAACPVAAGVAALVFSAAPDLPAEVVRAVIEHTADKVHAEGAGYDPVTGHSTRYGHGRVNAFRAVQAVQNGRTWPAPVRNVRNDSRGYRVYFDWTNPLHDVASVMVVRSQGPLTFAPIDGEVYTVGQQVAPNTIVVANDLSTSYWDDGIGVDGVYNYAIFVKNGINHYSWGTRTTSNVQTVDQAPLASISASTTAGQAPLSVLFSGGAIDPQKRSIDTYAWDFGDASTGEGPTIWHTYRTPGTYMVKLTATNSAGYSGVATTFINVTGSSGSTASFSVVLSAGPPAGSPALSVPFTVSTTGAAAQSYTWDFGDGSTPELTTVGSTTHAYAAAGSYTARVTVTDVTGASRTAVTTVQVGTTGEAGPAREVADGTNGTADTPAPPALCGAGATPTLIVSAMLLAAVRIAGRRGRARP